MADWTGQSEPGRDGYSAPGPQYNQSILSSASPERLISADAALQADLINACPVALCVVDASRKIRFANPEFLQLIRTCPALGNANSVAIRSDAESLDLRRAIADVLQGHVGKTVHMPLSDHIHGLSVLVTRLPGGDQVMLTVVPPRALMVDDCQMQRALRLRWALSEREAECALLLGQGMTAQRIADARGVSLPTIRTHLQSIREKLGVGSSLEAAAMIGRLSCRVGVDAS
ncbi:MAG: helix-turn-helix transcriptional regulator [Pseudomonadota bacterium]